MTRCSLHQIEDCAICLPGVPLRSPTGCYQPGLAHGNCPAGHPTHLDIDHYDTPRWVHCTIADLVTCPHDLEDVTGAASPGKHRVQP